MSNDKKTKKKRKTFDPQKYADLKAFCTSLRQTEIMEAIVTHGGIRAAARAIGVRHSAIQSHIKRVERTAAYQNWSPEHGMRNPIPDTHFLKRHSVYRKHTSDEPDGTVTGSWTIACAKTMDIANDLREFADALGDNIKGVFDPITLDAVVQDDDLITVYPLADLHLGMLAWSAETREDWDCKITSDALEIASELLVAKSPPSRTCIVANIGDFFHFDSDNKQTASGNILDADTRWASVVDLGVKCLLAFIRRALTKHEQVIVVNSIGNHDGQSALMLPFILKPYFMNEPRVIIDDKPRLHHYHIFGSNLLGFHHGHKTNPARLPMTMVNDQLLNVDVDTSAVEFTHWLTGHIHHESKEYDGILVESFRALCAKDAYHSGAGYRAGRDMQTVTYHRRFGECGRERVSYKMIQHYSQLQETKESTVV